MGGCLWVPLCESALHPRLALLLQPEVTPGNSAGKTGGCSKLLKTSWVRGETTGRGRGAPGLGVRRVTPPLAPLAAPSRSSPPQRVWRVTRAGASCACESGVSHPKYDCCLQRFSVQSLPEPEAMALSLIPLNRPLLR